jgi:hypothetical protein
LIIIFACTTFYLSYQYGLKTYIASTYPNAQVNREIQISNDAYLFLSKDLGDYTLNKRRFPKPFYELYCEDNNKFIDYNKPHLSFEEDSYQYYTLRTIETPIDEPYYNIIAESYNDSTKNNGFVFSKTQDSIRTYYFKDSVVDMQQWVKTPFPSYYNMSSTFFVSTNDKLIDDELSYNYSYDYNYEDYSDYDYNSRPSFSIRHQLRNKRNYELLERNDKTEIKKLLEDFLVISKTYKIDHNLTSNEWLNLVYNPNNYKVKNFIRDQVKDAYDYTSPIAVDITKTQAFYNNRLTDYHYDNSSLHNVFENIENIKDSEPIESIHVFMWLAFFFASIIFIFRITGLKHLLFSVITVGVLTLIVSLLAALLFYVTAGGSDDGAIYFISYFTLALGTLIICIPIFFYNSIKKIIVAICLNISLIGFSLYLFLIVGIISMHQNNACRDDIDYYKSYHDCNTLMESVGLNWSWILFFSAIIFIFFYTKIIKNWKSLPEV